MSIWHSKVSGEANTDPDLVGGEDWDAEHPLGAGTLLPVSATSIVWNATSSTLSTYARTRGTGLASRTEAGVYTFSVDDYDPPLRSGTYKAYTAVHSTSARGAWPSGWRAEVSVDQDYADVTLRVFDDTNTLADPTVSVDFTVLTFMGIAPDI